LLRCGRGRTSSAAPRQPAPARRPALIPLPGIKTEITEIATGIGALGHDLRAALEEPPGRIANVGPATWERLRRAFDDGTSAALFSGAWRNGQAFLLAADGLRGRLPVRVEWKGPDRQVEQDPIPADLRIDHVFLVSIKTGSDVLWNRSPAQVFLGRSERLHWFAETAGAEYQRLYDQACRHTGLGRLPADVAALDRTSGRVLAEALPARAWPDELAAAYLALAHRVAEESARRWEETFATPARRERLAWWLLRLHQAPYYLLGTAGGRPLRIRVDTPWDWRRTWEYEGLDMIPALSAGQPQVDWLLRSRHRVTGEVRHTAGYVEIRWSHRKFVGAPEAKVQLRSSHDDVPGYTPLV
jgi:hypothetical protein